MLQLGVDISGSRLQTKYTWHPWKRNRKILHQLEQIIRHYDNLNYTKEY